MQFSINISDELLPGIIASAYVTGNTLEQTVQEYADMAARKICQDLKVGPFYEGPKLPQFDATGTPFNPDTIIIKTEEKLDEPANFDTAPEITSDVP